MWCASMWLVQAQRYASSRFISLKALHAMGTQMANEHTSLHAWHISTPISPK